MTGHLPFPVYKSIDTRVDPSLALTKAYITNQGAKTMSYAQYPSQSHNSTNTKFTIKMSDFTKVDRRFFAEYSIRVNFQQPRNGDDGNFGLRPMPLASTLTNQTLTIGHYPFVNTTYRNIHAFSHFGTSPEERNRCMSGIPSFPDQFQTYNLVDGNGNPLNMGARNPFCDYSTNPIESTRKAEIWGTYYDINGNVLNPGDNGKAYWISGSLHEPIFIEPLNWSELDVVALNNIDQIELKFDYCNLARMLCDSRNDASPDRISSVVWNGDMTLHLLQMDVQDTLPFPSTQLLPLFEINEWAKEASAPTGSFASSTIVSDVYDYTSIPACINLFLREDVRSGTPASIANQTDTFARINHVEIKWGNKSSILSTATEFDLYNISRRNGNDQSYQQWHVFQGSVLRLRPGIDIPLDADLSSGVLKSSNVQYSVNYTNLHEDARTFTLFAIPIYEGYAVNENKRITPVIAPLMPGDVIMSQPVPAGLSVPRNFYGGSFGSFMSDLWSGFKKGFSTVAKIASPVLGALGTINPAFGVASQVANGLGSALGSGKGKGKRCIKAGSVISRDELKELAEY